MEVQTKKIETLPIKCSPGELNILADNYEKHTQRTSFDFWFWLNFFEDPTKSMAQIARETGLSRQRVHQIYRRWFARIIPDRAESTKKKISLPYKFEALRALFFSRAKLEILPHVIGPSRKKVASRSTFILSNGQKSFICGFKESYKEASYSCSRQVYSRVQFGRYVTQYAEFFVVRRRGAPILKESYYVFPRELFEARISKNGLLDIYLPIRGERIDGRNRAWAPLDYLEKWDYFK